MTLTVRLPLRVEQELAEYCVKRRISKSEAVKRALEELLHAPLEGAQYQRHPFIGGGKGDGPHDSRKTKSPPPARFPPRGPFRKSLRATASPSPPACQATPPTPPRPHSLARNVGPRPRPT